MGFFDFVRRPFKRKEDEEREACAADQCVNEVEIMDQIARRETQPTSLYGGLLSMTAGTISLTLGTMIMSIVWSALTGTPRYQHVHDWTAKHRLTWLKYTGRRRRTMSYLHTGTGRTSLKALGFRIVVIA